MAGFVGDSVANGQLDAQYGSGTPATLYCALSTTTPASDGTGFTEPSGGAYARVAVANNATNFPAASAHAKHCAINITFPAATASWGTISWAGWYDAATGGTLRAAGPLGTPQAVTSGITLTFPATTGFTATQS